MERAIRIGRGFELVFRVEKTMTKSELKDMMKSMIVNQAPRCIWNRDHHNMVAVYKRATRFIKSNTKGDV